eukprot:GEMP01098493.1.p1 GENE.GEMP01098493.1~~GEMP01098493.1.p1  ORF type:complete len:119 (+),score=40.62 GEMP01098493.1:103-459(+)
MDPREAVIAWGHKAERFAELAASANNASQKLAEITATKAALAQSAAQSAQQAATAAQQASAAQVVQSMGGSVAAVGVPTAASFVSAPGATFQAIPAALLIMTAPPMKPKGQRMGEDFF